MYLTPTEKAYIAGLLDGEGYIFFRRSKNRKYYGGVQVNITNKDVVDWLLKKLGGLTFQVKNYGEREKWMTRYRWELQQGQATPLLKAIKKYLIIKRKNAELYLRFRDTFKVIKRGRGIKIDPVIERQRTDLLNEYRALMTTQTVRNGGYSFEL